MASKTTAAPSLTAVNEDHLRSNDRRSVLDAGSVGSFCALGAAVCLESPLGLVWLVPAYTDGHRPEISAAHLARLVTVLDLFHGSRIASFTTNDFTAASGPDLEVDRSTARRSE